MFVEKVFSEIDTDERMFSVLMDEEEYALFSEFEERMYALSPEKSEQLNKSINKKGFASRHFRGFKAMNPELVNGTGANIFNISNTASNYGIKTNRTKVMKNIIKKFH